MKVRIILVMVFLQWLIFGGDDGTLSGVTGGHGFGRRISVYEARSKDENVKIVPYVERKRPGRH